MRGRQVASSKCGSGFRCSRATARELWAFATGNSGSGEVLFSRLVMIVLTGITCTRFGRKETSSESGISLSPFINAALDPQSLAPRRSLRSAGCSLDDCWSEQSDYFLHRCAGILRLLRDCSHQKPTLAPSLLRTCTECLPIATAGADAIFCSMEGRARHDGLLFSMVAGRLSWFRV